MSLRPKDFSIVPEKTARVARAAFPKGNACMTLRDELGVIYEDRVFASLFRSTRGRPAESPGCLALVTVLQFAEDLTDRQAADAVRGRIDWKYLLGPELTDPGFDFTLLHEFRNRLLENEAEQKLLDELLKLLKTRKLLKARGKQRTDSTHVLAAIRNLHRLELVGETLRHALNSLATVVPDWLRERVPTEWFERYGPPFSEWRLPKSKAKREALVETIGQDGFDLWEMIGQSSQVELLRMVPAVETLRQVWLQQYYVDEDKPRWRKPKDLPRSRQKIISPYDTEARFSVRRSTKWEGYRVHLTETCDEEQPLLITNVETTTSASLDLEWTDTIHQHLQEKELLPKEHLVDGGYVDARALADGERLLPSPIPSPPPLPHRVGSWWGVPSRIPTDADACAQLGATRDTGDNGEEGLAGWVRGMLPETTVTRPSQGTRPEVPAARDSRKTTPTLGCQSSPFASRTSIRP